MKSNIINKYKPLIDKTLADKLNIRTPYYKSVIEAMNYSVSNGGKRIRPALLLEFSDICGGNTDNALDMACALEMIHTYSLIHDDLPCMDNDDMRRGNPSCHIRFGEDIALLAGDALLTNAFSVASACPIDAEKTVKCISVLSEYAGVNGMIGGQVIDLESEDKSIDISTLTKLCELKTARLLQAACEMGCIVGNADENMISSARQFGYYLGLAFQIKDDILDVVGDAKLLGKPIGSDDRDNKSTFSSLLGVDKATALANEYTQKAINSLDVFGKKADELRLLCDDLLNRNN